jgi:hypothetical protein
MSGAGLYQVHFVVPAIPADLAGCSPANGNFRVVVTGPNSSDGADFCVQP